MNSAITSEGLGVNTPINFVSSKSRSVSVFSIKLFSAAQSRIFESMLSGEVAKFSGALSSNSNALRPRMPIKELAAHILSSDVINL